MIRLLIIFLLNIFTSNQVESSHKKMTWGEKVDEFCMNMAPIVIIIMVSILIICFAVFFGHPFATEANMWYYNMEG